MADQKEEREETGTEEEGQEEESEVKVKVPPAFIPTWSERHQMEQEEYRRACR